MNAPLPKSIQKQVNEAHAAQAAMAQQAQNASAVLDDPAQLPAPATPVVTQTPTEPPVVKPQLDDAEQKFRSMQGRYVSELAQANAQNKQLTSLVAQMQQQIDALATSVKAKEKQTAPAMDPKDIENFGADMIEMVNRYAEQTFNTMKDQFSSVVQQLDSRVKELETAVTGVSTRTQATLEQQFYAALSGAVPEWQQINVDPRWLEWLGESDPVYGVARQVALDAGRAELDVDRVANVFRAFRKAFPVVQQSSLADQVTPTSVSAPAPQSEVPLPILSSKFVEKFYNDKAKGRYAGREDEAIRIEDQINQAAASGRIR